MSLLDRYCKIVSRSMQNRLTSVDELISGETQREDKIQLGKFKDNKKNLISPSQFIKGI